MRAFDGLRQRGAIMWHSYLRFTARFIPAIRLGSNVMGIITFVASVVCIVSLLVYLGFDHNAQGVKTLMRILHVCQSVFIVNVLYGLTLMFRQTVKDTRIIKWVVDIAILLSLLPLVYPRPDNPWIEVLDKILYSKRFLFPVVGAYATVDFCFGIVKVIGRRTNPSLILSASFLLFIFIGSMLLMMPRCTYAGISYIDSLFISTSAVCITGLSTVDVASTFTPAGLLVLALLIQVGALGIMTFTSFFALFFSGNTSVYSQLMVRDMVYSKSMSALVPTLLYILGFTLLVELLGAVAIFVSVHGELGMDIENEMIFAAFHSLSAFCNAGFSNVEGGLSNPLILNGSQMVYVVITILVAAGGLGFPILVNFKSAIGSKLRKLWHWVRHCSAPREPLHLYDLNTKIVLVASFWVMAASTLLFLIFEYDNSLAGMPFGQKLVQAWFNAFVPRSSGFSSVNPAGFLNITIILFVFLMWIGGGSQSTAGGVKVNTFATMLINLRSFLRGHEKATAFRRTIAPHSIRRAHAVIAISILSLFFYVIVLVAFEPGLPVKSVIYEAASALFTVGSSLGITAALSIPSKVLLCTAMFVGRVGLISLLIGFVGNRPEPPYRLPADNVIIN